MCFNVFIVFPLKAPCSETLVFIGLEAEMKKESQTKTESKPDKNGVNNDK